MLTPFTRYLSEPELIDNRFTVLGYDYHYEEPVIDFGTGETLLRTAQRAGWDDGVERFTELELQQIDKAVEHLKGDQG